jgi:hypothetical protein
MSDTINMYCMKCHGWVDDWGSHDCPSGYWVVTDKEMVGLASKLYAMGITPLSAVWTTTEMGVWDDYEYLITLKIDIGKRINEAVLGQLPEGWKYHWETITPDKSELHLLGYVEHWFNLGFESLTNRISYLIKEFEDFLDDKDADAVKALILLTSS